ncbi:Cytochrome c oxidase subunit 3 [Stratiformator vulcanicus]|uniref:Cytochrome c oxidase subunit 3 n=2 Tax=Stratiformator vulcanicus TaxID=2527980 RepID=A0A517R2W9_9PLAN|nr:Cytochrome c oxidase subunit 3 [Stratiformator vulcanicus]
MFFVAGLIGYLIARFALLKGQHPVSVPLLFWFSTVVLLMGGTSMQVALSSIRRERQLKFRRCLTFATLCGICFCILQVFGMSRLLDSHWATLDGERTPLTGLLFVLILLHGLHFVTGLAIQLYVNWRALRGRYDHEYFMGVRLCTYYWRFLDVVWLAMFGAILLTT